jgi:hypothetical protein
MNIAVVLVAAGRAKRAVQQRPSTVWPLCMRLTDFQPRYNAAAKPFDWKFTRTDLADLLARIEAHRSETTPAPAG